MNIALNNVFMETGRKGNRGLRPSFGVMGLEKKAPGQDWGFTYSPSYSPTPLVDGFP